MNGFTLNVFCLEIFENNVDPDQTPRFAASGLDLHCSQKRYPSKKDNNDICYGVG